MTSNVIPISHAPRVFTAVFCRRLSAANRALRQLRAFGVRPLSCDITETGVTVQVNRNPHRLLVGCPEVVVTQILGKREEAKNVK
jgi:hypothetical protein